MKSKWFKTRVVLSVVLFLLSTFLVNYALYLKATEEKVVTIYDSEGEPFVTCVNISADRCVEIAVRKAHFEFEKLKKGEN